MGGSWLSNDYQLKVKKNRAVAPLATYRHSADPNVGENISVASGCTSHPAAQQQRLGSDRSNARASRRPCPEQGCSVKAPDVSASFCNKTFRSRHATSTYGESTQYPSSFGHQAAKSGHLNRSYSKRNIERPVGLTQPATYSGRTKVSRQYRHPERPKTGTGGSVDQC
jgi:hypothetical protein